METGDDNAKMEKLENIKRHLKQIKKLLQDPNAIFGEALVPVSVGVGTFAIATLFHAALPVMLVGTVTTAVLAYFTQRRLNRDNSQ